MFRFILGVFLLLTMGCTSYLGDTFHSVELTSSEGEKIYINTLNWGVTGDYQITTVSRDKNKVKERADSVNVIKGLEPFIYAFRNDTLFLYFEKSIKYTVNGDFETIDIVYIPLNKKKYQELRVKAYNNVDGYRTVPPRKQTNLTSDIPKPPSR